MTKKEILKELEGQEVKSLIFASVVGIENGKIISYGKELKTTESGKRITLEILKELWEEYLYQEGIN